MEHPKTFKEVWENDLCIYFLEVDMPAVELAFTLGERNGILSTALTTMNALGGKKETAEAADATL